MKAKKWEMAAEDFTAILEVRHDDSYGRFSRGMAFFRGGHIEQAHEDFSTVLKMNPNHVMARYARAGCYNTEGEFGRAIQDYTIALQCDEHVRDKRSETRLYLHETAEKVINHKLSLSYRSRDPKAKNSPLPAKPDRIKTHHDRAETPPPSSQVKRVTVVLTKQPNDSDNSSVRQPPREIKRVTIAL
ncbi:unnamed protein product [Aphanomyces euteiches]